MARNPITSDVLRLIGPGSNLEHIRALLAEVVEEPKEEPKQDSEEKEEKKAEGKEEEDTVSKLRRRLDYLEADFDKLTNYISMMLETNDKLHLANTISKITSSINDYQSACNATTIYTKEWFSRSFLSEDGKVAIAQSLLDAVDRFTKSNTETWKMIVNRDSRMMDYISYPKFRD